MRVLITGDRHYKRMDLIERELKKFPLDTVIIHGAATGADSLAGFVAEKLGMTVIPEAAQWRRYGGAAGPIRNQKMLDDHHPDIVLAFHQNISKSRGTKDMITRAKKVGLRVILIDEK